MAPGSVAIASACHGAALDLSALVKHRSCIVAARAEPQLPTSVAISIAPAIVHLRAGHVTHAKLVLTNTSAADVTLLLDNGFDDLTEVNSTILDGHGERVDAEGGQCGGVEGCGAQTIGIALSPGGAVSVPFDADGRMERVDDQCRPHRDGEVPTGSYDLDVFGLGGEAHAVVRITD